MKVLWLVSSYENAVAHFEQALASSRTGGDYLVRRADSLSQIPEAHLSHSGSIFIMDAFNPNHPGFEGLKKLRSMGFAGHVFVAGEPSPETAAEAFKKFHLSGFFGTLQRIDYKLAAGVIHSCFNYKDEVDLRIFLDDGGRTADEQIANSHEFTHFVQTLGSFVSRFGINPQLVKKVLMGLSLGHMKMGPSGPSFEGNFTVKFGLDKKKLILSLRGLSKGCAPETILGEFTEAVLSLGSSQVPRASLFPDMHHVVRSANSLQLFSGGFDADDPSVDPLSLLTVISFPGPVVNNEISAQWFGYCHVKKCEDMSLEMAQMPLLDTTPLEEVESEATEQVAGTPQPIDETDLQKLLADPAEMTNISDIEGRGNEIRPDQMGIKFEEIQREPQVTVDAGSAPLSEAGPDAAAAPMAFVNPERTAEINKELEELRKVSAAMTADLHRLMKERREPTTDRELREAKVQLEEKNKKLSADKKRLEDAMALKEKEIEELKARVEELRSRSAA
jgi:hypothetical protein